MEGPGLDLGIRLVVGQSLDLRIRPVEEDLGLTVGTSLLEIPGLAQGTRPVEDPMLPVGVRPMQEGPGLRLVARLLKGLS